MKAANMPTLQTPMLENCPFVADTLSSAASIASASGKTGLAAQLHLGAEHLRHAHAVAISGDTGSVHPVVRVQITKPNHAQLLRAYVSRAMRLMPKDTDNVQMHIWLQELANQIDAVQS